MGHEASGCAAKPVVDVTDFLAVDHFAESMARVDLRTIGHGGCSSRVAAEPGALVSQRVGIVRVDQYADSAVKRFDIAA